MSTTWTKDTSRLRARSPGGPGFDRLVVFAGCGAGVEVFAVEAAVAIAFEGEDFGAVDEPVERLAPTSPKNYFSRTGLCRWRRPSVWEARARPHG